MRGYAARQAARPPEVAPEVPPEIQEDIPVEWWGVRRDWRPEDEEVLAVVSLEVSGVTVAFGGNRALDGVAMTAPEGRVTGLIGPNGAGKSTLFDVICGLRRPSPGGCSWTAGMSPGWGPRAGPGTGWPGRSNGWSCSAG